MKLLKIIGLLLWLGILPAAATDCFNNVAGSQTDCGVVNMFLNSSSQALSVTQTSPLPVANSPLPSGATAITGNAAGTTGAVVGTLAGVAAKTTYICGFDVSAIGGAAQSSPITIAGLVGSSMVYQTDVNATAGKVLISRTFTPCIPASAVNTAITITTTAAAGATAVNVNSSGYQQ